MKDNKRKTLIKKIILIISIIIGIGIFIKNQNTRDKKIEKLKEYGNKVEQMDLLPNTIIAKVDGEEILFHELQKTRNSLNYAVENGTESLKDENAFYNILESKLEKQIAEQYKDESDYNLDIEREKEKIKKEWYEGYEGQPVEEYRKDLLNVLYIKEDEIWLNEEDFVTYLQNIFINMKLQTKGMIILDKFMLEKPELAKDKELTRKVEEYNRVMDSLDSNTFENQTDMNYIKNLTNNLLEIEKIYKQDLLLQKDIELCVDKKELSTKVPELYQE